MKGQMKRIVAVMLSIMMVFTLVPLSSVNAASKAKLNKKSATIYVGKTVQLKVNNNKKKVKWSTSNKKIAIVNKKGKVTGKKAGKVTITAKIGKKKYNCKVTVKNKAVVEPTNVPETVKTAEQPTTSIEQSTTKPAEQPTTKPAEQPTTKPEQPSTNPVEETTTDNYGDSGEDWIVKSTSNKCWIQEYVGNDTDIVIPSRICGKPVVGVAGFLNNKKITSVKIPIGVISIENSEFYRCSNLTSIIIPDSVTSIGKDAFGGCSSLTSITIPDSVTSIGSYAFEECSSLTSVTIPNSVTSIGFYAFGGCYVEKNKIINNSKFEISGNEFYGMILYDYKDNGMYINDNSIIHAEKDIKEAIIPNGITSIGNRAFMNCNSLTNITISNSVTSIGSYVFEECSSLTSITIPNSVTSIGVNEFNGCYSLTSIKGKKGSYAESWANSNGYTFIPQ